MKKIIVPALLFIACLFVNNTSSFGWGVYGHQHITRSAIFALPKPLVMFFYTHEDFITEECVVPDLRKYTINDKAEFPRHYIDLEAYNYTSVKAMPQTQTEANLKYSKDTMQQYGILPWYIQDMMEKLTNAFKNKRKTEILFLAADLSHYIGDAHMPLHTSINHDGQYTNQKGIHAFWESQLPEMFGDKYNLYTGEAHYISDVKAASWAIIEHSHQLADTLLLTESMLKKSFPEDKIYLKDGGGQVVMNKFHSPEYAAKYHELLNGMVENQMRAAIAATADFWYTAWINAGKPDLTDLDSKETLDRSEKYYGEDLKEWKQGKAPGLKAENEFPVNR